MAARKNKTSEWIVGTNDVGQATLNWKHDPSQRQADADPFERTHDFLRDLEVDGLSVEHERGPARTSDPYNSTGFKGRRARIEAAATKAATKAAATKR